MLIQKFKTTYQSMNLETIDSVNDIYHPEIEFVDPFHKVSGLNNLAEYFTRLYQNLDSIEFVFGKTVTSKQEAYISWNMKLIHPRLKSGKEISLDGISFLKFSDDNKIIFHRDYFDGGAMLYENVPVIGRIVRWLKEQI